MGSGGGGDIMKSYFDVLALCCSSEVALVEKILNSLPGVKDVSVIVPTKTVIVVHDSILISPEQIAKALNQAKLEANVKVNGRDVSHRNKWPRPHIILCGALLALSFLKYAYPPLQWLSVVAVAVGVWPITVRAFAAIRNFKLYDVNILVLIAVIGSLALQDYLEAATIVFLFTIAEWLQSRASHKATAMMSSLMNIAPPKATIAETGEEVNVEDVKQDTILAVKAGQAIPIDGVVVDGTCEVDEKALTGEAFPVAKQKDSTVWAGTINLNGYVSIKTTALAGDCVVAKMAKLVEEAQRKGPRIQNFIDKCAKFYTPAVVLVSALLAVVPAALRVHNLNHWLHLALVVLVSACPCALVLATPVATFCALSRAAVSGLLIKGGDCVERLAKVKAVGFDKTGTITRGEFVMAGFQSISNQVNPQQLLYWVSSLESKSSHPIADAVVDYGRSQSVEPKPEIVQEFQIFPGEGIFGKIDGREIYVGNRKCGLRAGCVTDVENSGDGRTLGFVYSDNTVIGTFNLSDTCRSGAINAIKDLKSMSIRTAMLTGDSKAAAMHAQIQLGNALDEVHAELLPEEKAAIIEEFKKSVGATAMVGDGINDAPALAVADVGISMGVSGSALATETGHVILMSNDITKIPIAIKLAKRARRKVIENIVFSVTTKAAIMAVAIAGHPIVWLAVLADVLTCLLVILNSMTLLRQEHKHGGACSKSHLHAHSHAQQQQRPHAQGSICRGSSDELHHHHHHHHHHDAHGRRDEKTCAAHDSLRLRRRCHEDNEMSSCQGSRSHHHHHHHHAHAHDIIPRYSVGSSMLQQYQHGHIDELEDIRPVVSDHTAGVMCEPLVGICFSQETTSDVCKTSTAGKDIISCCESERTPCSIQECSSHEESSSIACNTGENDVIRCCEESTSTCLVQECSSEGLVEAAAANWTPSCSTICCDSVDCSDKKDSCDNPNDCQYLSVPSKGCRDFKGQEDGCLRVLVDHHSGRSLGRICTDKYCSVGEHPKEETTTHEITEVDNRAKASCSHARLCSSNNKGSACHIIGNKKLSGCSRSFRAECCQGHGHVHVNPNFTAPGSGGGGRLLQIVTE